MEYKSKQCDTIFFIFILILVVSIVAFTFCIFLLSNDNKILCGITLAALVPSTIIAYVAYKQLPKLTSARINDHLMSLDKLWHTSEIIEARKIIDQIFQECHRIRAGRYGFEANVAIASEEIYELSKPITSKKNKEYASKFIYILALIEFFDTLGFLYINGGDEEKMQIKSMFYNSVIFYYRINKVYIDHSSSAPKGHVRFKNFTYLYKKFEFDEY